LGLVGVFGGDETLFGGAVGAEEGDEGVRGDGFFFEEFY
jgi:hypothetical protein